MLCHQCFSDAVYTTAHGYPGGLASLAARMKVNATVLSHKVNPNNATHHLTADEWRKLLAFSGDHSSLHAVNAEHGYLALPLPSVDDEPATEAITDVVREFSEFLTAVTDTLADHRVTKIELRRVRKELGDLVARGGQLQAVLAAMEAKGGRA